MNVSAGNKLLAEDIRQYMLAIATAAKISKVLMVRLPWERVLVYMCRIVVKNRGLSQVVELSITG